MPSENTGGTQAATIGVEHTLASITTAGTYQLLVDTSNMADGDTLELRIDVDIRSGATTRTMFYSIYKDAQGVDDAIKISPPVPAPFRFAATLLQVTGTGRNYIWSIYEY